VLGDQAEMKAGGFAFGFNRFKILELTPAHFLPCVENDVWNFGKRSLQTFVRSSLNSLAIP
jgi:hypothetical protein